MKVVVLAGGLSSERDVSLKTGAMVAKALRENKHQVILLDVFMGYTDAECDVTDAFSRCDEITMTVKDIPEIAPDIAAVKASRKDQSATFFGPNVIKLCQQADVVFMALHGENGENGKVQAAFDLFGIKYTGTGYLGSAIAMDKNVAKLFLRSANVPCANSVVLYKKDRPDDVASLHISLPCVVKPCNGGSSIGVSIARTNEELEHALDDAFTWEDKLIIEDYIKGREFSVGVLNGKALPIIEIAPLEGFYDYKNKYKAGSAVETCPAELTDEQTKKMQGYAEAAAKAIGLGTYSRIDFLIRESDGAMFCLEANTLPGMTPTSLLPQEAKVVGMDFNALCEELINLSL